MIDPAIKKEWVTALRSGEYKQGKTQLRTADDKFCCLGVLCDIALKHGVVESPKLFEHGQNYSGYMYEEEATMLPVEVQKWVGGHVRQMPLINLNDSGKSFETIANYIEENL